MDKKEKKPFYKKTWVWIAAIVLIAIIASTSSQDDTPKLSGSQPDTNQTSEQTVFKVGDVIAFDGKEVTVTAPERNWNSGNEFITPDSGNEFVKVKVTIENKSENEASYNSFDWKIKNSDGVIKDISSTTYTIDNGLESGELAAGGKASGFLVFETPAGDKNLTLQYSPSFWSDKKVEVKL